MFKKSLSYPLAYFIVATVWQLILKKEISWIDNIGVCFIIFLFILSYNWSKVPYEWKRGGKS
ncbi:isoprenylcysteine carboxyl methyltransferase (ICMT) family protein YpbQ [Oikeobacillus pervagus]|uniref:Isoprenylcysteine carboxyl methyltransferase (ICMT) family protein YpbQ n=1 Tax=Oikeobacillus pervagus TaxID=1325931 RepID=A0AAJ1T1J9_9BACI|nr:hypothetical protein [Oikeobacillus pervagus]MDQ0216674.1 isoprenylcysteine carboxyl methyltransferase (ICMT) family protein YpbQ [Oikeobacillus pervagus]